MKITINLPPGIRGKLHGSTWLRPVCKRLGITELNLESRGFRPIKMTVI